MVPQSSDIFIDFSEGSAQKREKVKEGVQTAKSAFVIR